MKTEEITVTPTGPFSIYRRSAKTGKWSMWCYDNDEEVMRTRFDYMFDVICRAPRDARDYDAVQLLDRKQVISSAEVP